MTNKRRKGIYTTLGAIITAVVFVAILFANLNPLGFYKLTHPFKKNFDTTQDYVKFLDVGQGDSAIIYSNGYSAVIDVGENTAANDVVVDLFDSNIKTVNALLVSHLHSDHVGALPKMVELFKIEHLIMPELFEDCIISAQTGRSQAMKKGTKFHSAKQGMNFNVGEFEVTVLSAFPNKREENNRSLFVMAKIGDTKFLFTGDAEKSAEKKLLQENLNLDCDVLKVSHHGSDTSSSQDFLTATTPEYAVISVGEDNEYYHPHDKILKRLKRNNAKIYRTDQDGDITFFINNGDITIETEK